MNIDASAAHNAHGFPQLLRLLIVAIATALALAGCASSTSKPNTTQRAATHPGTSTTASTAAPTPAPAHAQSILPGNLLIADEDNNRVIEVNEAHKIVWYFPHPGDLAPGQTFKLPDDVFFSPDGTEIVATQEENSVISVINVAHRRIVFRYGQTGTPGNGPNQLSNPDDALMTRGGIIVVADIKNCRLLAISRRTHHIIKQLGKTGTCTHAPPTLLASPNGVFPTSDGGSLITEINGDWVDIMNSHNELVRAIHPPGFTYPSDTNEVQPGRFISVDYVKPGAIEIFDRRGKLIWRYAPTGKQVLNQPSLAEALPNGDVIANDDKNHRVIIVDPHTNRIVWQYGHTGRAGSGANFLDTPDGLDLAPPHSLMMRYPGATLLR